MSRPARRPEDDAADADLVRRIRAGDRGAVDDLYERFRRPAFALARRILGDDVLAEDVLQDVFLSVWRDPGAFDGGRGSFASWLLAWSTTRRSTPSAARSRTAAGRPGPRTTWSWTRRPPTRDVEDDGLEPRGRRAGARRPWRAPRSRSARRSPWPTTAATPSGRWRR